MGGEAKGKMHGLLSTKALYKPKCAVLWGFVQALYINPIDPYTAVSNRFRLYCSLSNYYCNGVLQLGTTWPQWGQRVFGETSSSPCELGEALSKWQFQQLLPLAQEFLNEVTVDTLLLASQEQFKDHATDRLLLFALKEYEDLGTTQKKTPAKMST